ncbi:MAG: hypothetical protein H6621_04880 [Halobacteriovoraceae bacterium]|nr:hypothetical protein [Halobacteriovoraceae bacterium]
MLRLPIFIILLITTSLFAQDEEMYFGPEFTFSNKKIFLPQSITGRDVSRDTYMRNKIEGMNDYIINKCREKYSNCRIKIKDYKKHIYFSEDLYFYLKGDENVIEVNMPKMTIEQMKEYEDIIQDLLFDSFAENKLFPQKLYGSGHISIERKNFLNIRHLQNFIADYHNHPGLSWGFFEKDSYNAIPFFFICKNTKKKIKEFLSKNLNELSFVEFARSYSVFRDYEYPKSILEKILEFSGVNPMALSWFNVGPFTNTLRFHKNRLEVRAHRAQENFGQFIDQCTVYRDRIISLKNKELVPLNIDVGVNSIRQALAQAQDYFSTSTIKFKDYRQKYHSRFYRLITPEQKNIFRPTNRCSIWINKIYTNILNFLAAAI